MRNPLSCLQPILALLSRELNLLPALGGAIHELQRADPEEIEEILLREPDDQVVTEFHEDPLPARSQFYRSTPPLYRSQNHLFRFFVDGSIRTYFLGTGIESNRSFPIELAQIGAAIVKREDNGTLKTFRHEQRVLLLLPKQTQGLSQYLWDKLNDFIVPGFLEIVDYTLPDRMKSEEKKDPRDKAGGKARSEMHKLEISLISSTETVRSADKRLVLDGSVKFTDEDVWKNWKKRGEVHLIGVAKSFAKDPLFQFGKGSSKHKDITQLISQLEFAHRTAVFKTDGGKVAFWYVRLREQKELDYPLMGVVKVELPRPDLAPVPSAEADLISQALMGERNVTPYGLDHRWHCSLYPIHIAEKVIKSHFYSSEVLMGCLRFPRAMIGGTA